MLTTDRDDQRDNHTPEALTTRLDRRRLLQLGAAGAGLAAVSPLLAACGGSSDKATATKAAAAATNTTSAPAATATSGSGATGSPSASAAASSPTAAASPTTVLNNAQPTNTPGTEQEGKGGKIICVRQNDSDSLDPQRTVLGASWEVFRNIFDSLVTQAPSLDFEPVVAEKYEISTDGLTYTFSLRDGLQFHDGTPLTVDDVKYTFDRATDKTNPSQAASFIDAYDHADLVDASTINLVMKQPSAPFLPNIAVEYFGILPKAATDAAGDNFGTNPVGSGPWKFKEWIQGEQITLEPNADYKQVRSFVNGKGGPAADQLTFRTIAESQTQLAAFQTGEVNVLDLLPNHEYPTMKNDDNYQVFVDSGSTEIASIEFAEIAPQGAPGDPVFKPPFDDLKLRQAVAYAINADDIIDKVYNGLAQRNYGMMPTGIFAYDPAIEQYGYHYDPDKAKQLLADAGWADSNNDGVVEKDGQDLKIAFWCWTDDTISKAVQVMQNQLSQVGIKADITTLDIGTMVAQLPAADNNINFMDVGWPEADILYVISGFGWGAGHYHPQAYMDLLQQARQTADLSQRKQLYFQAQQIFLKDLPEVPLWSPVNAHAVRKEVKNFKLGYAGSFIWEDVYVEN